MAKHVYQVSAYRRVRVPEAGHYAHRQERRDWDFPFGKGQKFATGRLALAAAEAFANQILDLASEVAIWRMAGNSGTGSILKNEPDLRFDSGWGGVSVPAAY